MRSGAESTVRPEMSNYTKDLFGKFSALKRVRTYDITVSPRGAVKRTTRIPG
jgi:hypothetical protein